MGIRKISSAVAVLTMPLFFVSGTAPAASAAPAVSAAPAAFAPQSAPAATIQDPVAARVFELTNQHRAANGLRPLRWNQAIAGVAQRWSETMRERLDASDGTSGFEHNPSYAQQYPDGWTSAAENIAIDRDADRLFEAWKNSPGHNRNMLSPTATDFGFGYARLQDNRVYGSKLVATQNFAGYPTPPPAFADVARDRKFAAEIEWLTAEGISTGWPDGTFRPDEPVARDAMAAFMYRLKDSPRYTPALEPPFTDVPPGTQFAKEIDWLSTAKVAAGWRDGTYRPGATVDRQTMAAFLYRLAGSPDFQPPATTAFTDVPASNPFYKEIAWLASTRIATGWKDGSFRPDEPVMRDAMAAFMFRFDVRY